MSIVGEDGGGDQLLPCLCLRVREQSKRVKQQLVAFWGVCELEPIKF